MLTVGPAVVISRRSQFVFHHRVEQHEAIPLKVKGEVSMFARVAVEPHQHAIFPKYTGKLVHDAAFHTAVVVFSGLSDEHQVPLAQFVAAKKVVQGIGKATFQRCRRRHASP